MLSMQNRRRFLAGIGAMGLIGLPGSSRAEPPPEITTLRLPHLFRSVCDAPKNVAGELLHAEGFTDVRYVEAASDIEVMAGLAKGEFDFITDFPPPFIAAIEAGIPLKTLTGLHSGCLELIANDSVRGITDLKGKRVGVFTYTSAPHVLLTLMTAYVGLDPARDIEWIEDPNASPMDLFKAGKIDAFLGTAPEPQEMRAAKMGHTILNTTTDRPWSQHFCCMLGGNAAFVEKYPVATKRALRAMLKAADLCASNPELAAKLSVDGKFTDSYDFAVETLRELRYDRWREFDPADTLRFYALRMHEAGLLKANPNQIITDGSDWRFLNELKRELKT